MFKFLNKRCNKRILAWLLGHPGQIASPKVIYRFEPHLPKSRSSTSAAHPAPTINRYRLVFVQLASCLVLKTVRRRVYVLCSGDMAGGKLPCRAHIDDLHPFLGNFGFKFTRCQYVGRTRRRRRTISVLPLTGCYRSQKNESKKEPFHVNQF